ncbi:MAG: hypothetical protein AAGI11_16970 [Pseudomonadota bacterium]
MERGAYRYLLNGEPTRIKESFIREVKPDGTWHIESERHAPGVHLAVSARGSGRRVRDFAVSWKSPAAGSVAVDYRPGEAGLQVRRWRGQQVEKVPFDAPANVRLSPLMRVFAGPLIADIIAAGGTAQVLVPDVRKPEDGQALLRPLLSERRARLLDEADGLREVEYLGDQYGPGTRFWLAADDKLVRYSWQQATDQVWEVELLRD